MRLSSLLSLAALVSTASGCDDSASSKGNDNISCAVGSAGCACTPGGACDGDLHCDPAGICTQDSGCGDGWQSPSEACDGGAFANGHCEDCRIVCDEGFADCGGGAADGCETHGLCTPTTLVAAAGDWPRSLTVADGTLFWVNYDPLYGSIQRVAAGGGPAMTIASSLNSPYALAANASHVYFVNAAEVNADGEPRDGGIFRIPAGGGEPELLEAESIPFDIAIDDSYVYWVAGESGLFAYVGHDTLTGTFTLNSQLRLVTGQSKPRAVATWSGYVYWLNTGLGDSDGAVLKVPAAGGTTTILASAQSRPVDLAVYAGGVVWLNRGSLDGSTTYADGAVMRVDHDGGNLTTLASGQEDPGAVAVDDRDAYWATGDGNIMRVALTGGTATPMATGEDLPCGLAVDAIRVYWSNCGDGTIRSLAK